MIHISKIILVHVLHSETTGSFLWVSKHMISSVWFCLSVLRIISAWWSAGVRIKPPWMCPDIYRWLWGKRGCYRGKREHLSKAVCRKTCERGRSQHLHLFPGVGRRWLPAALQEGQKLAAPGVEQTCTQSVHFCSWYMLTLSLYISRLFIGQSLFM